MKKLKTSSTILKNTIHFYMNKDLKNGLLVAGGAILLYLLYKKFSTKEEKEYAQQQ